MGVRSSNLYIDSKGVKRCKFMSKRYPEECDKCHLYVPIFCGCECEDYRGEGVGTEEWSS